MEHGSSAQHHLAHLLTSEWDESFVQQWLKEDVPSFDYGGFVVGDKTQEAHLLCKARGILAGVPFFVAVFKYLGCTVEWHQEEGVLLAPEPGRRIHVATVRGPARKILVGERTALNMLARASGIATLSRQAHEIAVKHNYQGVVAGTRKTTPGFRVVEKYALLVGGCDTHRMDLSSMIMLKDNHVWSSGSIRNAVKKARQVGGFALKIEVECQSEADAYEALEAGADIVMLDNLLPEKLHAAAANVKAKHPHALLEASGGVTMETLPQYFGQHVDVISMGNLTQGVPHIDFSLKIKH